MVESSPQELCAVKRVLLRVAYDLCDRLRDEIAAVQSTPSDPSPAPDVVRLQQERDECQRSRDHFEDAYETLKRGQDATFRAKNEEIGRLRQRLAEFQQKVTQLEAQLLAKRQHDPQAGLTQIGWAAQDLISRRRWFYASKERPTADSQGNFDGGREIAEITYLAHAVTYPDVYPVYLGFAPSSEETPS